MPGRDEMAGRVERRLRVLERDRIVQRIWREDHTVWRPDPAEIANRLGWLDIDRNIAAEVDPLGAFAAEVAGEGYTTAVLLGMGGSSLAPRVLASTLGSPGLDLIVLDSTVPAEIRAVSDQVATGHALFIASSKSGTTIETSSLLDYFWDREPDGRHYIAITDAGSPLETAARERKFRRVFLNADDIGGRYSALSYVGLVPAALLGADLERLLAGAAAMREACGAATPADGHPGARLGAVLGEATLAGHDLLRIAEAGEAVITGSGPGGWIAQLLAESTGKEGTGILPFADEPLRAAGVREAHPLPGAGLEMLRELPGGELALVESAGDAAWLGGMFFCWEFATAIVGHILGIHPFDQPDVEEAKRATTAILEGAQTPSAALAPADLLEQVEQDHYLALHAYLPRTASIDRRLRRLSCRLHERVGVPVAIEYGPALLHSTGQYHKGGGRRGAFIQLTMPDDQPLPVPGRAYNFEVLKEAQAAGDRIALQARHRLVARSSLDELEALW